MTDHADVRVNAIAAVCAALLHDDCERAAEMLNQQYPFEPLAVGRRSTSQLDSVRVFLRDGFVDRYTGARLVFPPVLRLISEALPAEFPYHPNWKFGAGHVAYWELTPTVDHLVPVARGGTHEIDNWVTTSMLKNEAKGHWTLEELGWDLFPPGRFQEWDGSRSTLEVTRVSRPYPGSSHGIGR